MSVQTDTIAKEDHAISNNIANEATDLEVEAKKKSEDKTVYPPLKTSYNKSSRTETHLTKKRKKLIDSDVANVLSTTRKSTLKKSSRLNAKKQLHLSDSMIHAKIKQQKAFVNIPNNDSTKIEKNVQPDKKTTSKNETDLIKTGGRNKDTTSTQPLKKNAVKKYILSAGMGLQQQIPFNGQRAVPYNHYGRKGSLYDYIPSLYFRVQREKKLFVQGEFRYGAPQTIKDLSYSRQTKPDSSSTIVTSTTLRVKKTFYHQLPLSVNYYVLPSWSVGAGGIYSRFYKAVTEQEIRNTNVQSGTETVTKKIIQVPHFTDSFFYKSQVQIFLQTEYQWRRFTLGLRYKIDLQPFIKYTTPDGLVDEEKNQSIEAILRYRLWQSTKK